MIYLKGHTTKLRPYKTYNQCWRVKLPVIDDDERITLVNEVRCIPMLDQLEGFPRLHMEKQVCRPGVWPP